MTTQAVKVDCIKLLVFVGLSTPLLGYVLFQSIADWPSNAVGTVCYLLMIPLLLFVVSAKASRIVLLEMDQVSSMSFIGVGKKVTIKRNEIRKITIRPDYRNIAVRMTVESMDGRKIELFRYQSRFRDAVEFLQKLEPTRIVEVGRWSI